MTSFSPPVPPPPVLTQTTSRLDTGLAVLRIVVGIVFLAHGSQKLFAFGIPGIATGFAQMGVPLPTLTAPLVTFVEFLGGIALILGLVTRIAALLIGIDMLCAIILVHGKNGFFLPTGFEFALTLLTIMITLILTGAGAFSVDAAIRRRRTG